MKSELGLFGIGILSVLLINGITQVPNNQTKENCELKFAVPVPISFTPNVVITTCGVYGINNHIKNNLMDYGAVTEMNNNIRSAETFEIKSTGFFIFKSAYEVNITK